MKKTFLYTILIIIAGTAIALMTDIHRGMYQLNDSKPEKVNIDFRFSGKKTMINIEHLKATPCGAEIRAEAVLIETEGRKYVFALEAYDSAGLIAKGTHERFAVKADRFMEKTEQRITK